MDTKYLLYGVIYWLTACGGGAGDDPVLLGAATPVSPDDAVEYHAYILPSTSTIGSNAPHTYMDASFNRFLQPVSADFITSYFDEIPGCHIKRHTLAEIDSIESAKSSIFPPMESVSAGEQLTIATPTGSWPDMQKNSNTPLAGYYEVGAGSDNYGLLPLGSVLNVPGDTFPVIGNIELVTAPPLTSVEFKLNDIALVSGTDLATRDITLHWDANDTPDSRILLSLINVARTENDEISSVSIVNCNVADTGNYSLPDNIRQEMDDAYQSYGLKRMVFRSEKRGNTLITIQAYSHTL